MIFFSIGLPAPFAEWCDAALLELARRTLGTVEFLGGNSLEDVATSLINTGASHLVVGSRMPNAQVRKLLASSGARFALCLDDPRVAVVHLQRVLGWNTRESLKAVANSCAFVSQFLALPGALVLSSDKIAHQPISVVRSLGAHFGLSLSDDELEKIIESLRLAGRTPIDDKFDDAWTNLGDFDQATVIGALQGYTHYLTGKKASSLIWQRELFLTPGPPVEPVAKIIDITGRGRCLLFGPDINLTPGFWTAHVIIGCSKEALGIELVLDVCAGVQLSQTRLHFDRSGLFEVMLRFFIDEINPHPVQVRVFTERAVFDGRLALGRVVMVHQSTESSFEDKELSAELGLDSVNLEKF